MSTDELIALLKILEALHGVPFNEEIKTKSLSVLSMIDEVVVQAEKLC